MAYKLNHYGLQAVLCVCFCSVVLVAQKGEQPNNSDWLQWGGPHRDFKVDASGLATSWPAAGPRQLWSRALGDGYSAIAAEGNRLFTIYRDGEDDVVIAIDAANGKTAWEYRYPASFSKEYELEQGPGPRAMPLIVGDQLYTVGATGKFNCLNKQTGKLVWSHDLVHDFNGTVRARGYSSSPIAYKDTVIAMVGGVGHALVAFNQRDGSVVWKKQDFDSSYSSLLLINVDGQDQLVAFMFAELIGVDPNNGELLWSQPHKTESGVNVTMPVWGADNLLFASSAYDGGSRVIKLTRNGGKTTVEQVWANKLMRVHFGNAIRVGDQIYASSGDFGPSPFTAVDVKTGQVLWRNRSLARLSMVWAGKQLILLDEDGNLALATLGTDGLTINSRFELFKGNAWTVPTLAGGVLYARDRQRIIALDLR